MNFYKNQNDELMRRLDEFEQQLDQSLFNQREGMAVEESLVQDLSQSHQHMTKLLREENHAYQESIRNLKANIEGLELKCTGLDHSKLALEQQLRSADYNVDILKNQLEQVYTEQ